MDEWLSTERAAKLLTVSTSRIRAMVGDGLLTGEKRGRDLFISTLSLDTQRSTYGQLTTAMRIRVFIRDNLTCQECGLHEDDPTLFHVHHKVERANGGTNELPNLETLCCDCHKLKHSVRGGKSPEEQTTKLCNFRFKPEVMWLIEDLVAAGYGKDKTDVVSRAIMEAKERLGGGSLEDVARRLEPSSPVAGKVSVQAVAESVGAPFHPMCKHCGSTFGAFNRFASLCPECKTARHIGDPRDCPVCTAGNAI